MMRCFDPNACRFRLPVALALGAILLAPERLVAQPQPEVTAARIDAALHRGLEFIYSRPRNSGRWVSPYAEKHPGGVEALVAMASIWAAEPADSKRLKEVLGVLDRTPCRTTLARALRAMVYARLPAEQYGSKLTADINWLTAQQQANGGWGYGEGHPTTELRPDWTDNTNTFFALAALRAAAGGGLFVSEATLTRARNYLKSGRNDDGGWGWEPREREPLRLRPDSYGTMTAGGVAGLLYTADSMPPPGPMETGSRKPAPLPMASEIAGGRQWLLNHLQLDTVPGWQYGAPGDWLQMYRWMLVRAFDALGSVRPGGADLRASLAGMLLDTQQPDGSWAAPAGDGEPSDLTVRTCFAILAMSELRRPPLLSRVPLPGAEGLDARDAARTAMWYSDHFGQHVTWQRLVPGERDWPAGLEAAPLVYLVGVENSPIPKSLGQPLRKHIDRGGVLLVHSLTGGSGFATQAEAYFSKLLPHLSVGNVNRRHPLYLAHFQIEQERQPKIRHFHDALRSRVFILHEPIAGNLHEGRFTARAEPLEIVANAALYATDKRGLPGRFDVARRQTAVPAPQRYMTVSRIRHGGGWNLCPGAFDPLSDTLAAALSIGVQEGEPVDPAEAAKSDAKLLWLTGTGRADLTSAQMAELREYVERGGTLFIDAADGDRRFGIEIRKMLVETFGEAALRKLENDDDFIRGEFAGGIGSDLRRVKYSRTITERNRRLRTLELYGVRVGDRWGVIFSPYGVTCAMEGIPLFGQRSLSTDDARRLAANIVLYATMR